MTPTTRKKILFVITKSNWGGAQRYVYDLATHLNASQYECVVALGGHGELAEKLLEKNIRVLEITSLARDISLTKEFRVMKELWHIIHSERPDILHINSSKAGGLGALIGRFTHVPRIVFTAHAWAFNEARPWWQKLPILLLHYITVVLAHTTITVSDALQSQMRYPFARGKMVTIHNGRDTINFLSRDDARNELIERLPQLRTQRDAWWSVTIGELHKVKQHDRAILALSLLVQSHPELVHIIIGDGEERSNLEELINKKGLREHVFLMGSIHEAARYIRAFDLFLLPSRSEALGFVLIEACQAGIPIIASRVGGIPEVITHKENGLLVTPGDSDALARAYEEIVRNPKLATALGEHARARANDFTLTKMLAETIRVYESNGSFAT